VFKTCKASQYPQSFCIPFPVGTVPVGPGMPNLARSDREWDVGSYDPWIYCLKSGCKVDNAVELADLHSVAQPLGESGIIKGKSRIQESNLVHVSIFSVQP
jgi:hypothetical protein